MLTVHHAYMHTFSMSPAIKITENHKGVATILMGFPGVVHNPPIDGLARLKNPQPKIDF